jgi:hypothetical protein
LLVLVLRKRRLHGLRHTVKIKICKAALRELFATGDQNAVSAIVFFTRSF